MAKRKYSKEIVLQIIQDYIDKVGYVPVANEFQKNKILYISTFTRYGGYENLLKELGYEYPKWRADDYSKEQIKEIMLKVYGKQAPSLHQIEEDYQKGNLPFSSFVIRRKFNTLNSLVKYCEMEFNQREVYYYDNEEIKEMFLDLYDINCPPTQQQLDFDYKSGDFKFSSDMLYKKFGSYNKFLNYCGCKVFNGYFGEPCIANDGHFCDSKAEKFIDDFLFENDIKHNFHVCYKQIISDFDKNDKMDWLLEDGTVVEYFGLMGNEKYEDKVERKLKMLNDNNIPYIAIYLNDLNKLDIIFSKYLVNKSVS